ncbi:hypothetical protein CC80DRAFT_207137 [Byssothecium circinans]|uniref:Zn(2)-C6 fungal-type domain-containing protein n=1 Tax=Byssothecium circinans TaxID=147558 RepID=A0A6A5TH09_9PLEO|nr:hypothetical protein CC80DRAFT_207137 [Byssothecium circinans]
MDAAFKTEFKHIACARCRERKVKCDGGRPSCRRCVQNQASCQYVKSRKQQGKKKNTPTRRVSSQLRSTAASASSPQALRSTPSYRSCFQESSSPRTPSPYYHDDNTSTGTSFTPESARTPSWSAEPFPSTSLDSSGVALLDPFSIPLDPSISFCGTSYTPDYLSSSNQSLIPLVMDTSRSYKPIPQASEARNTSFEGVIDAPYPYTETTYVTRLSTATNWDQSIYSSTGAAYGTSITSQYPRI